MCWIKPQKNSSAVETNQNQASMSRIFQYQQPIFFVTVVNMQQCRANVRLHNCSIVQCLRFNIFILTDLAAFSGLEFGNGGHDAVGLGTVNYNTRRSIEKVGQKVELCTSCSALERSFEYNNLKADSREFADPPIARRIPDPTALSSVQYNKQRTVTTWGPLLEAPAALSKFK